MELMHASKQWASRPADQRFLDLVTMRDRAAEMRGASASKVVSTRNLRAVPVEGDTEHRALAITGPNGAPVTPTHWSFGQLAQRAGAPAGYLRDLPAPLAADCLNHGFMTGGGEDMGVLLQRDPRGDGTNTLAAATGPQYGRVWNETILNGLVRTFGDGRTGNFRVPGEFGKQVEVTKANTTLYASDRDFFVFLADEENRIEIANRREGRSGSLARGFFVWNSEVGAQSFGVAAFLFDYACSNRIVWGAQEYKEVRFRHTASAPHRYIEEVAPALQRMAQSSSAEAVRVITDAQAKVIGDADKVRAFLAQRFTKSETSGIIAAHMSDEGRPIETLWDAATGITAYARGVEYQDARVKMEREAGKVLELAA